MAEVSQKRERSSTDEVEEQHEAKRIRTENGVPEPEVTETPEPDNFPAEPVTDTVDNGHNDSAEASTESLADGSAEASAEASAEGTGAEQSQASQDDAQANPESAQSQQPQSEDPQAAYFQQSGDQSQADAAQYAYYQNYQASFAAPAPATPASRKEPTPGKVVGTCKWFDLKKGWGFILRDGEDDVFVHKSCCHTRPGYKGLCDNEEVEFDMVTEPSGRKRATSVYGLGGEPCLGQPEEAEFGAVAAVPESTARYYPPHTTGDLEEGRHRGTVKSFNPTKGFGFLTPTDGSADVFVHQSDLRMAPGAYRSLAEGENVEFTMSQEPGKSRRKALKVTGPGGGFCVGVPKPPDENAAAASLNLAAVNPMSALAANPLAASQYYAAAYQNQLAMYTYQQQMAAAANPQQQLAAYAAQSSQMPGPAAGQFYGGADPYAAYFQQQQAQAAQAQHPGAMGAAPYGFFGQQQAPQQ